MNKKLIDGIAKNGRKKETNNGREIKRMKYVKKGDNKKRMQLRTYLKGMQKIGIKKGTRSKERKNETISEQKK